MTDHLTAEDPQTLPGVVEPPLACEICQRFALTQWHTIVEDHAGLDTCSAAGGSGYWLCAWCHEAAHQHMATHPGGHAAQAAVLDLLHRFTTVIETRPRSYKRSRSDNDQAETAG